MKLKFPRAASDVFPFRPIPGTEDFDKSVRLGYKAPRTLEEWGGCLEDREAFDDIQIPEALLRTWKRYGVAATRRRSRAPPDTPEPQNPDDWTTLHSGARKHYEDADALDAPSAPR